MNKRRRFQAKRRRLVKARRRRFNDRVLGFLRHLKGRMKCQSVFNRPYSTVFPT